MLAQLPGGHGGLCDAASPACSRLCDPPVSLFTTFSTCTSRAAGKVWPTMQKAATGTHGVHGLQSERLEQEVHAHVDLSHVVLWAGAIS